MLSDSNLLIRSILCKQNGTITNTELEIAKGVIGNNLFSVVIQHNTIISNKLLQMFRWNTGTKTSSCTKDVLNQMSSMPIFQHLSEKRNIEHMWNKNMYDIELYNSLKSDIPLI